MQPMRTYKRTKEGVERRLTTAASELTPADHQTLTQFCAACYSEGLSSSRVYKYISNLSTLLKATLLLGITKPLREWQEAEIRQYVAALEQQDKYSKASKQDFKVLLKKLFRYLNGGKCPASVDWLRIGKKTHRIKFNAELLTEDEIERMIGAEGSPQIKAFLGTLYESGGRHAELLSLNLKDVRFDPYGCLLSMDGKTGPRTVRICKYAPLLRAWVDSHPQKNNPDVSLWVNYAGRSMGYAGFSQHIKRAAERVGIRKRVFYHLFRHSRSTHTAGLLSEAFMKQYFGWQQNSSMPSVYIHLKGDEMNKEILRLNGIEPEAVKEKPKAPIVCTRCEMPNMFNAVACVRCAYPLGAVQAIELEQKNEKLDSVLERLLAHPKAKELLKEIMAQGEGLPAR